MGVTRLKDDYFLFRSVFIYKNNHIKLFFKKNYTKIYFNLPVSVWFFSVKIRKNKTGFLYAFGAFCDKIKK
jgi:hypothetical protein